MTWPAATVSTSNVDASGDNPGTARADLLDAIQKLNQIISHGAPVLQAGTQTIDGAKTFSSALAVPAGSTAGHAVNKSQMDSAILASNPDASTAAAGHIRLATTIDTVGGTSSSLAVTPSSLAAAMLGGHGQAWTNMTASRAIGTTYVNSTGRLIIVVYYIYITTAATNVRLIVDGHYAFQQYSSGWPANSYVTARAEIPNGSSYVLDVNVGGANLQYVEELR